MIAQRKFIEYSKVYGNYYGTSYSALMHILETHNCIMDLFCETSMNLKSVSLDIEQLYILIVSPHADDFITRLRHRGTENEEQI